MPSTLNPYGKRGRSTFTAPLVLVLAICRDGLHQVSVLNPVTALLRCYIVAHTGHKSTVAIGKG